MKINEVLTSQTKTYVNYDIYVPGVMIRYKAIIQIHHAMSEYSGRYQRFAEFLAHEGYVVVVCDFPGHGRSLYNFEQGYFGFGDATDNLVEDMQCLRNIMASKYPDLPYFMLGNELGSVVLRKYITRYGDYIQGCILMGTCGKPKYWRIGKLLLRGETILKGEMHRSKTIKKVLENNYRNQVKSTTYMTTIDDELKAYDGDPFTDFIYTNGAYCDIMQMIKEVSLDKYIGKIPNHMSILIVSGKMDPFGYLGKGPRWFYQKLEQFGLSDLTIKIYAESHKDILHDKQRREVYQDILNWLNDRTYI